MAATIYKIDSIDEQIKQLIQKKERMAARLDKQRLVNFRKLGLFEITDSEVYGLIIAGLLQREDSNVRGAWQAQGETFLTSLKAKPPKPVIDNSAS